jgi:Na+-driven multidrug efflux pump
VQAIGVQYLRIIGFSFPLQVMSMAISSLLRSTENVKVPLLASMGSVLTNTLLNYMLIGGHLGAPALGVTGAAIASLAASGVNLGILLWCTLRDRTSYIRRVREQFRWSKELVREYYTKCAPIIANETLYGLGVLLINRVLGRQGADALAAVAIFRSIEGLIFAFFGGFANASSVMVGKLTGAGQLKEALHDAKQFALLCPLITLMVCIVVTLMDDAILGLFSPTPITAGYVHAMLLIYMVGAPLRTCNYIQVNIFRAGGETLLGALFEIGGILLISAPIVNLTGLYLHLPFLVVFASMYIEEIVKVFLETSCTLSGRWVKPVTPEGKLALPEFQESLRSHCRKKLRA